MLENTQSSGVTKFSSTFVAETVDRLKASSRIGPFRCSGSSITAVPPKELVCICSIRNSSCLEPRRTARWSMRSAPLAGLDLSLKVLIWDDGNGAVSVSYNSPGFTAERLHIEGALDAPFEAVESIVEAALGA